MRMCSFMHDTIANKESIFLNIYFYLANLVCKMSCFDQKKVVFSATDMTALISNVTVKPYITR